MFDLKKRIYWRGVKGMLYSAGETIATVLSSSTGFQMFVFNYGCGVAPKHSSLNSVNQLYLKQI